MKVTRGQLDNKGKLLEYAAVANPIAPQYFDKTVYPTGSTGAAIQAIWLYQKRRKIVNFTGIPLT